jgi:hypothetical protein
MSPRSSVHFGGKPDVSEEHVASVFRVFRRKARRFGGNMSPQSSVYFGGKPDVSGKVSGQSSVYFEGKPDVSVECVISIYRVFRRKARSFGGTCHLSLNGLRVNKATNKGLHLASGTVFHILVPVMFTNCQLILGQANIKDRYH